MTGEELKAKRLAMDLDQAEFAELLRTTAATISRWENGNRKIPPYLDLALETVERRFKKKTKKPGSTFGF